MLSDKNINKRIAYQHKAEFTYFNQLRAAQLEIVKYERELLNRYHQGAFADEIIRKADEELDIEELRLQAIAEKVKEA